MATRTVTGFYDSYDSATHAVHDLEAAGIPHSDISLVANNADNRYMPADKAAAKDGAKTGAGTGASIGTALGGGAGLLAGLGILAIPGVGPVVAAGWLIATAVGAAAGAATGGVVGALTGAGISKEHAHVYAEGIRRGGSLVTAHVDESRAAAAEQILRKHGHIDPDNRGQLYREHGWKAFDERAQPLTAAELDRERTLV
jgi:hypothetical protein